MLTNMTVQEKDGASIIIIAVASLLAFWIHTFFSDKLKQVKISKTADELQNILNDLIFKFESYRISIHDMVIFVPNYKWLYDDQGILLIKDRYNFDSCLRSKEDMFEGTYKDVKLISYAGNSLFIASQKYGITFSVKI